MFINAGSVYLTGTKNADTLTVDPTATGFRFSDPNGIVVTTNAVGRCQQKVTYVDCTDFPSAVIDGMGGNDTLTVVTTTCPATAATTPWPAALARTPCWAATARTL